MNAPRPLEFCFGAVCLFLFIATLALKAAPVIDPIGNVTVPAGKSLTIPITATVTNGRSLTYTVTGTTNAIAIVLHNNNPFWKLNVAQACASNAPGAFLTPFRGGLVTVTNVGDLTFMLFPEYAPKSVAIFEGITASGFYNSNTIFHEVQTNFVIAGGDPLTNGTGGLVFEYNDEFNPQAMFTGNGQLALSNSGKNTDGSEFFVTLGPQRTLDFRYPIIGQLVRGFQVLTNISTTAVNTNNRPLADEIFTMASLVPDTSDTVITLVATNRVGRTNTITVVASDGAGGFATNVFKAVTVQEGTNNLGQLYGGQPFIYGNPMTNLIAPKNVSLTNYISAVELNGDTLYWWPLFADANSQSNSAISGSYSNTILRSLAYNVTNVDGTVKVTIKPTNNYVGPVTIYYFVSPNSSWINLYYQNLGNYAPYDEIYYTYIFGDTPIVAQAAPVAPQPTGLLTNLLLATFTNGVVSSAVTNFTVSIQWGDDSITPGTITTNTARQKQVIGSHTYLYSGNYPISMTIQDTLGATAVVSNLIPVIPSLTLTRSGTNNVVGWPAWAFAYGMQSSTNLARPVWVTVTNASALSGFQNVVSNPPAVAPVFFRLKQ